jgi:hypothetical protein
MNRLPVQESYVDYETRCLREAKVFHNEGIHPSPPSARINAVSIPPAGFLSDLPKRASLGTTTAENSRLLCNAILGDSASEYLWKIVLTIAASGFEITYVRMDRDIAEGRQAPR